MTHLQQGVRGELYGNLDLQKDELVGPGANYRIFWTIRRTQVLEKENRGKNFEAKNVVKYLIT